MSFVGLDSLFKAPNKLLEGADSWARLLNKSLGVDL